MKWFLNLVFTIVVVFTITGCMSIERSATEYVTAGDMVVPGEQILITNYGYYLFGFIPLFTGSDTGKGLSIFVDDATLDKTQKYLSKLADEEGASIVHIQPKVSSTCSFSVIPMIGSTLGILWYKDVQLSATMVKVSNTDEMVKASFENKSIKKPDTAVQNKDEGVTIEEGK